MRYIRKGLKYLLKQFTMIPSYCKDCGHDIRDFIATDDLWKEIMKDSNETVCYNCFCDRSETNFVISRESTNQ